MDGPNTVLTQKQWDKIDKKLELISGIDTKVCYLKKLLEGNGGRTGYLKKVDTLWDEHNKESGEKTALIKARDIVVFFTSGGIFTSAVFLIRWITSK